MGSEEILLTTGVPDEFGKALRNENGLYKVNNYEPTNKNAPYKAKKCSTPKPYKGHTYKHTIIHNRQYKEYEPRTYDRVYVMSKLHHDKPKQEKEQKPPEEPKKTKTPEPTARPVTPSLPYSAVGAVKRSLLLTEKVRTATPEQSYSVFS